MTVLDQDEEVQQDEFPVEQPDPLIYQPEEEDDIDERIRRAHERLRRLTIIGVPDFNTEVGCQDTLTVEGAYDTGYAVQFIDCGQAAGNQPVTMGACCQGSICSITDAAGCASIGGTFHLGHGCTPGFCASFLPPCNGCGYLAFDGSDRKFFRKDYACVVHNEIIGQCLSGTHCDTSPFTYFQLQEFDSSCLGAYSEFDHTTCVETQFNGIRTNSFTYTNCAGDTHDCDSTSVVSIFCPNLLCSACAEPYTDTHTATTQMFHQSCPIMSDYADIVITVSDECRP